MATPGRCATGTAGAGPRRRRHRRPLRRTVARAGGKVIKNVAGYDLGKLFAGAFGTLGLIAQVTVRLHPRPPPAPPPRGLRHDPARLAAAAAALAHRPARGRVPGRALVGRPRRRAGPLRQRRPLREPRRPAARPARAAAADRGRGRRRRVGAPAGANARPGPVVKVSGLPAALPTPLPPPTLGGTWSPDRSRPGLDPAPRRRRGGGRSCARPCAGAVRPRWMRPTTCATPGSVGRGDGSR